MSAAQEIAQRAVEVHTRLLIVEAAGEAFALDTACVQEIVAALPLTRASRLPECALGYAALRGEPFPVLDLAALIGCASAAALEAESCLVLLRLEGAPVRVALATHRILGTERVAVERLSGIPAVGEGARAARLDGVARIGERSIPVLDLRAMLEPHFAVLQGCAPPQGLVAASAAEVRKQAQRERSRPFLGLHAGDIRVAISTAEIARVAPLVRGSEAGAPPGAAEVVEVDGTRMALLDAASVLGARKRSSSEQRGVVVVGRSDDCVALAFDAVESFHELEGSQGDAGDGIRRGLVETAEGVLELVSLRALLAQSANQQVRAEIVTSRKLAKMGVHFARTDVESEKRASTERTARAQAWKHLAGSVLLIELGGQTLALPGSSVVEVLRKDALISAPGAPAGVVGLIDLRGAVHPVVDLATRLDLPRRSQEPGRSCIVMVRDASGLSGLLVDAVLEWVVVGAERISAPDAIALETYPEFFLAQVEPREQAVPLLAIDRVLCDERPPYREQLRALGARP